MNNNFVNFNNNSNILIIVSLLIIILLYLSLYLHNSPLFLILYSLYIFTSVYIYNIWDFSKDSLGKFFKISPYIYLFKRALILGDNIEKDRKDNLITKFFIKEQNNVDKSQMFYFIFLTVPLNFSHNFKKKITEILLINTYYRSNIFLNTLPLIYFSLTALPIIIGLHTFVYEDKNNAIIHFFVDEFLLFISFFLFLKNFKLDSYKYLTLYSLVKVGYTESKNIHMDYNSNMEETLEKINYRLITKKAVYRANKTLYIEDVNFTKEHQKQESLKLDIIINILLMLLTSILVYINNQSG